MWNISKMWNGLIVVMYALEDINPGDGGLICVPGSHKANINSYKPPVDSHLVVNPAFKAGDMLIFTEALVHGTITWTGADRRRALLYKYSPGYSTWSKADALDPYLQDAQSFAHNVDEDVSGHVLLILRKHRERFLRRIRGGACFALLS